MMNWGEAFTRQKKKATPLSNGVPPTLESKPWDDPIPLEDVPDVEAFPLDVFHDSVAKFLEETAAALACTVDYAAVPALVIAGASIGASRALEIKSGWEERPSLYAAVIAPTGSAKSPALKAAARPVYKQQAILHEDYKSRLSDWKEAGSKGKRPTEKLVYVRDTTVEKMGALLQENPRGFGMIEDELVAWVNRLDSYKSGKGSDRQFYLSAWAGEPVSVHRKTQDESIFVAHPFISVVGGIPPSLLADLRGQRYQHDGFFERILPSYPTPPKATGEDWRYVESDRQTGWAVILEHLRGLQMKDDVGGKRPFFVRLAATGRIEWERFTNRLAELLNDELLTESLRGNFAKHKGYCARLALIIHELRIANKDISEGDVDGESVKRAGQLISYFQSHARKVFQVIDADPRLREAKRVLRWLRDFANNANSAKGSKEISQRDLHRGVWGGSKSVEDGNSIILLLIRYGWMRQLPGEDKSGPGRKPGPRYEIHPTLFS
jgi:hypothetical protein